MTFAKAGAWAPSPVDEGASPTIPAARSAPVRTWTEPGPPLSLRGTALRATAARREPFRPTSFRRFAHRPFLRPGRGQMCAVRAGTHQGATRRYPLRYRCGPLFRPATVE